MKIVERLEFKDNKLIIKNTSGILHDDYEDGEPMYLSPKVYISFDWGDYNLHLEKYIVRCMYCKVDKYLPAFYLLSEQVDYLLKNVPDLAKRKMMEELIK